MKLYFSKDACSLAPHIVARGGKGQVPVLDTGAGALFTEGPIICQYLADHAGALSLIGYRHLQAFMRRVGERSAVRQALRIEALHA